MFPSLPLSGREGIFRRSETLFDYLKKYFYFCDMEVKRHTINVTNPRSKMYDLLHFLRARKEEEQKNLREKKECTFTICVK